MNGPEDRRKEWERVDARILGQLLAAQNMLFVLPDDARIEEFFSQALSEVPGVASCFVCLGEMTESPRSERCSECMKGRSSEGGISYKPPDFSCPLSTTDNFRTIPVRNSRHTFGFFVFKIQSREIADPYWPFLRNLANYVALSLENRMQRLLLEKARDELEARVLQRTEELRKLNETLEQRVRDEVALNRAKDHILIQHSRLAAMGEILQNIAHQWRQPLNAISLILANIEDDYDYKELTRESLGESVAQAYDILQRMSKTIDDFRDFFKSDRTPDEFEMHAGVDHAIAVIEAAFKNSNITITKSLEPGLKAFGHPGQFAQAVLNILTNAGEAIQNRTVPEGRIEIRLSRFANRGILSIQDNGGGIPEEILGRIFDPYFTTKESGTGIGLYMSRMIIEKNLKGTIQAENSEGGTVITISLPLLPRDGF